jgi:rubrerythrin
VHDNRVDHSEPSRRRFFRAGLSGVALAAAVPLLARQASASPATTTTAPPQRPTADDIELLLFAEAVELAARDLYAAAVASGAFDERTTQVLSTFGDHHRSYADAIAALLGPQSSRRRDDALYDELEPAITSPTSALRTAAELEDAAVATHTALAGQLRGMQGVGLVASILVVEAQHATTLFQLDGETDLDVLLSTRSDALTPATDSE